MAKEKPVPVLLSDSQRAECSRIAQSGNTLHGKRATALLLIDNGVTHRRTSVKTGLTIGQVRYVLNRFRKLGLAVFPPPSVKEPTKKQQKPKTKELKKMAKELKKDKKKKDKKEKVKKKKSDSKKKKDKKKKDKKKKK